MPHTSTSDVWEATRRKCNKKQFFIELQYFWDIYRVNVPIKLTNIYIENFLEHNILVSVQKAILKLNMNLTQKYLIWFEMTKAFQFRYKSLN